MKIVVLLILVLVVGGIVFFASDEFNRTGFLGSEGFIDSGSKFGIQIGMDRNVAEDRLRSRGLESMEPSVSGRCLDRPYPADQQVGLWLDDSRFGGTICLASRNNQIVSIGWALGGWEW